MVTFPSASPHGEECFVSAFNRCVHILKLGEEDYLCKTLVSSDLNMGKSRYLSTLNNNEVSRKQIEKGIKCSHWCQVFFNFLTFHPLSVLCIYGPRMIPLSLRQLVRSDVKDPSAQTNYYWWGFCLLLGAQTFVEFWVKFGPVSLCSCFPATYVTTTWRMDSCHISPVWGAGAHQVSDLTS